MLSILARAYNLLYHQLNGGIAPWLTLPARGQLGRSGDAGKASDYKNLLDRLSRLESELS